MNRVRYMHQQDLFLQNRIPKSRIAQTIYMLEFAHVLTFTLSNIATYRLIRLTCVYSCCST